MLRLRNKTRSASKVGYLVKAVRGGFEYAGAGDIPVGVVTQVVPAGLMCKIQTEGDTLVYAAETITAGVQLRTTVEDEGGKAGQAYNIGDEYTYVAIGHAITHGRGLIEVSLNITTSAGGSSGTGLPSGGIAADILTKVSSTDGDATWQAPAAAGIPDAPPDSIAYSRRNANWVNSNLIIDRSGGTGAATAIVNYDERLTIVGDGTYISSTYSTYVNGLSQTIHQIALSLTPGALDTRWDVMTADGTIATARPYTTAQIGNTANVAFLEGVYTSISYALNTTFTDYSPTLTEPANEVTIEVDHAQLRTDGYLYYQSDITTLLAGYATQSWVTSNFDNYNHWDVEVGGVAVDVINTGDAVNFASGTNMTVTWGGPNTITFAMTTAFGTMSSWNWRVLGVNHGISNGGIAEIISGTGISIGYTLGGGGEHQATITNSTPGHWTADTNGITYADNVGIGAASHATTDLTVGSNGISTTGSIKATGGGTIWVDNGSYYARLHAETLDFTRNTSNYIKAATAGGTLSFITNGLGNSTANALIYIGTTDVTLRYGSSSPVTKLQTTSAGVEITGDVVATGSAERMGQTNSSKSGFSRFILNNTGSGDAQLSFQGNSSTKWSMGNEAGADAFIISRGYGAFGTNDHFKILTTGNAYFTHGVYAAGEIESYDTSDMRFKNIIGSLNKQETAEAVFGLDTFRYTQKGEDRVRLGVSAQAIQKAFPENVKEDVDGKLLVHYGKMVPTLIATIQYQEGRIRELERKLAKY